MPAAHTCGAGHNESCDQCRSQVWQGDAVEFYFSRSLHDTEQNVTELDISPLRGGVWASYINNSDGYQPQGAMPIPCDRIRVLRRRTTEGWDANITVAWPVLAGIEGPPPQHARVNFYRWDYGIGGTDPTVGNASAWSVTHCDGRKACNPEHVPKYFGVARFL